MNYIHTFLVALSCLGYGCSSNSSNCDLSGKWSAVFELDNVSDEFMDEKGEGVLEMLSHLTMNFHLEKGGTRKVTEELLVLRDASHLFWKECYRGFNALDVGG